MQTHALHTQPGSRLHPLEKERRRGFAMPLLLILMTLMTLTVQGLWRTAWSRESMSRTDADLLQTRQAARALIQEALRDIMATEPPWRHQAGSVDEDRVFFPQSMTEWEQLAQRFKKASTPLPCTQGICLVLPVGTHPMQDWQARRSVGANTGAFIPSPTGVSTGPATGILHRGTAVYWVEILPFDSASASLSSIVAPVPDTPPLVYRVTAFAQGGQAGTRVLQQLLWLRSSSALSLSSVGSGSTAESNDPIGSGHVLSWQEWLE